MINYLIGSFHLINLSKKSINSYILECIEYNLTQVLIVDIILANKF